MHPPIRPAIARTLAGGKRLTTEAIHLALITRHPRITVGHVAGELGRMLAQGAVAVRPQGNDAIWKL
jgi:hypothetical protein